MKKILFLTASTSIVLLTLAVFITFSTMPSSPVQKTPLPSITQIQPNKGELLLSSVTPSNNSTNIPLSIKPAFSFTTQIDTVSPIINVSPPISFTYSINNNTLTILPANSLSPSTKYDISLEINHQAFFVSFTTTGPTPTQAPDTKDEELLQEQQEALKTQRPDIYLSNSTPYKSENLSVTSFFTTSPIGHFRFNVTSKNKDSAPADFALWAQTKGLTSAQISTLDVVYN